MPNHVTTRCIVTGDTNEVKRFKDLMFDTYEGSDGTKTQFFNFDKIIPQPEEVEESSKKQEPGLLPAWYTWRCENWGTKWNSYEFKLLKEEPLDFSFETAWSPPFPVLEALAKEFPKLQFECYSFDEGWNFGCKGFYNPPGEGFEEFRECEATEELYEIVYGEKYIKEEEEE